MMKRENLIAILAVVLIALGVMFFIGFYLSDDKQVVQGLGIIPQIGCTCTDQGHSVGGGSCLSWNPPKYCEAKGDPAVCSIIDNCEECGCESPVWTCQEDGTCTRFSEYCGDGSCDLGETCENCPDDCGSCGDPNDCVDGTCEDTDGDGISEDCGSDAVCMNGCCVVSTCGDEICDYRSERCDDAENCFRDCEGEQAYECADGQVCIEYTEGAGAGYCGFPEAPSCSDGTAPDNCSIITYGGYCQYDTDAEDYLLTGSCGGLCPCPEDYICGEDGFCSLDDGTNTTQESPPGEDPIDNYCEYVGGICQEECSGNYFALDETEYPELIEDCRNENSDYQCCYPYENDDINDCEYYGGSCMADCGTDYYHADVQYIDDECEYYGDSGDLCCIPYETTQQSGEVDIDDDGWINSLFGGDDSTQSESGTKLNEGVNLNAGLIAGGLFVLVGVILLGYLFVKTNKK